MQHSCMMALCNRKELCNGREHGNCGVARHSNRRTLLYCSYPMYSIIQSPLGEQVCTHQNQMSDQRGLHGDVTMSRSATADGSGAGAGGRRQPRSHRRGGGVRLRVSPSPTDSLRDTSDLRGGPHETQVRTTAAARLPTPPSSARLTAAAGC